MICIKGHDHSSSKVKVAKFNKTEPHGIRPFHCPECRQTTRVGIDQANWVLMALVAAIGEGRPPCHYCFQK
jgi:hypothetical protein